MPSPAPRVRRSGGLARLAFLLLALQILLGATRIPTVVIGRRCSDVADHRRRGPVDFFLDTAHQHGAAAVAWIRANVPADGVVLYRGNSKGSIEFVPGMIAPRLLVAEGHCAHDATEHTGRPLARRGHADGNRVVVLVALDNDLRLEDR